MHENTIEPVLEYKRSIIFNDEYAGAFNNLIVLDDEYLIITQWLVYGDPINGRIY